MKDYEKQYEKIKSKIQKIGLIKKGTITERWHVCGTVNCKCKKDKKYRHGPYYWLTWKRNKKTKSILLPKELMKQVEEYKNNFNKLQELIEEMEIISENIIKNKVKEIRENRNN